MFCQFQNIFEVHDMFVFANKDFYASGFFLFMNQDLIVVQMGRIWMDSSATQSCECHRA
jgi:hypothetical protein